MIEEPRKMVFRRPSLSPIQMQEIAPQKQPTLYEATEMPGYRLAHTVPD